MFVIESKNITILAPFEMKDYKDRRNDRNFLATKHVTKKKAFILEYKYFYSYTR